MFRLFCSVTLLAAIAPFTYAQYALVKIDLNQVNFSDLKAVAGGDGKKLPPKGSGRPRHRRRRQAKGSARPDRRPRLALRLLRTQRLQPPQKRTGIDPGGG